MIHKLKDNIIFQIVLCLLIGIGFVYFNYNDSEILNFSESVEKEMTNINLQVLNDELEKYNIVLKSKDRTAICVQSMMVSAALLQAGKEKEYLDWKRKEKELCDY